MTPETIRNLRDQCLAYESRSDVMIQNPALYRRIKRAKLDHVCFAHMPVFRRLWTVEELVREARKFTTRTEMRAENPGLYQALLRRNLQHLLPPSRKGKKS